VKRYVLRRRAINDLESISGYTLRKWGRAQARKYLAALRKTFVEVARSPERHPKIEDREDGLRRARSGSHLIIYAIVGSRIEIVRVLHEAQDVPVQLG